MEIRNYEPGNEIEIMELFEMVYKRPISYEQWLWRFRDNPAGAHLIKLMWDNDKLVGHYAVSPVVLNVNGEVCQTCHSLTTMTHPDYGRQGIFTKLANALYFDLEEKLDYHGIWGFPNSNSHYGFIKKLGWSDVGLIHTLQKDIEVDPSSSDIGLNEVFSFNENHATVFNDNFKDSIHIERSVNYLNWRYFKKPSVNYKVFSSKNKNNLFVTKTYYEEDQGDYILNLLDFFVEDVSTIDKYVSKIINSYDIPISKVSLWMNVHNPLHINLEKLGYKVSTPLTFLAGRFKSKALNMASDLKQWNISMGDSDVF